MAIHALHQPAPIEQQDERRVGEGSRPDGRAFVRRGPMRPDHLVSARKRIRGEVIAALFRMVDFLLLAMLAAGVWKVTAVTDFWATSIATLAPHACALGLTLTCLIATGAYGFRRRESLRKHLARVFIATAFAGLVILACLALAGAPHVMIQIAQAEAVLFALALLSAHLGWMGLVRRWRRQGYLTPNVVVVGANENARLMIERAVRTGEFAVLGIFDDRHQRAPGAIAGVPVLGDVNTLLGHRIMPYVDRVVITVTSAAKGRVRALVERLGVLPNDITLLMDFGSPEATRETLDRLADLPLARLSGGERNLMRVAAKRVQDVVIGVFALVLAAPAMALIALAVKLESPGPVFFRQTRQGFNNEEIVVWKFRSMRHEARKPRDIAQVRYDDPRITRVGRIIRRTSLDELPQLFNVLAGDMSLVGPRPHAPGMKTGDVQSALLVAHYAHRHRIKPGMTGWAAVNGSRGPVHTPDLVRRRVELDIAYIERQSLWFDLYIMIMTLPCLLGDGKVAR